MKSPSVKATTKAVRPISDRLDRAVSKKRYKRPLWRTPTHQDIWTEKWCDRCTHNAIHRLDPTRPRCPLLSKADTTGRKPAEWEFNDHAQTLDSTIRCNTFSLQPPVLRRPQAEDQTLSMFEIGEP